MNRDSIDFAKQSIPALFARMFIPTLFGMLSMSAMIAIDGIFVGQGVGSAGIAAINLCVPLLMVFSGLGLMIGVGCSVTASIHLSKDNEKAARINVTQALWLSAALSLLATAIIMLLPGQTAMLLGSSESLKPMVTDYLLGWTPGLLFQFVATIGLFVIRLDGSPRLAMWCNVIGSISNIILDWLFIYPLGMGVLGAAIASTISTAIDGLIAMSYMLFWSKKLRFYRLKMTFKSLWLSLRNIGYQCKIGSSALLGELTMAIIMYAGNMVFMQYLGDDGVGAFGIACYYLPFVFMVGGAIAQSAQPIISYNISESPHRSRATQKLALLTAFSSGLAVTAAFMLFPKPLVALFLDTSTLSAQIAIKGLPLFALGFTFFVLNLTSIGYYQSVEKVKSATFYAILRGLIFSVPAFLLLPLFFGEDAIWLAMPLSETLTFAVIVLFYLLSRKGAAKVRLHRQC